MNAWIISLSILLLPTAAAAAPSYVPLEPLPFVKASVAGELSFADLLNGFFQLSLVLGAAITAVMLTVGGVQYMLSDAAGGKQQGKDRIRNALLGFLLLMSVYVIIRTINPDLLRFDLSRVVDVGCKQGQCVERNTPLQRTVTPDSLQAAGEVVRQATAGNPPTTAPARGYYVIGRAVDGSRTVVTEYVATLEACNALMTNDPRFRTGNRLGRCTEYQRR